MYIHFSEQRSVVILVPEYLTLNTEAFFPYLVFSSFLALSSLHCSSREKGKSKNVDVVVSCETHIYTHTHTHISLYFFIHFLSWSWHAIRLYDFATKTALLSALPLSPLLLDGTLKSIFSSLLLSSLSQPTPPPLPPPPSTSSAAT